MEHIIYISRYWRIAYFLCGLFHQVVLYAVKLASPNQSAFNFSIFGDCTCAHAVINASIIIIHRSDRFNLLTLNKTEYKIQVQQQDIMATASYTFSDCAVSTKVYNRLNKALHTY